MKGVFPCFGVCWQNVNNSFLTIPFFLRNREGFRRLGKTRYMFTLTRFSELYYNTVYTKKYECQFYLLLLLFVFFFFIQISKFRKSFECLSAEMHLFLFVFNTGNRKIKSCNLFCNIAAERVEKLCSTFSIQNKLTRFVGTQE